MTKEQILSEKTLIPVGFFMALVPLIGWLAHLHYSDQSQAADIVVLNQKQEDTNKMFLEISQRLARIEGKLGAQKWISRKGD